MRRRFVFRLGRLLRVRELQEEQARGAWTVAEAEARALEARAASLVESLEAGRRDQAAHLAGPDPTSPGTLLAGQIALEAQARALQAASREAAGARREADELGEAWRARERERRALQELSEREAARHRSALERAEEAERDERSQALTEDGGADSQGNSSGPRPGTDGFPTAGTLFRRHSDRSPVAGSLGSPSPGGAGTPSPDQ